MNAYFVYGREKQENVLVCRWKNGFHKFTTAAKNCTVNVGARII